MSTAPFDVAQTLAATAEQARANLAHTTRSAAFNLSLGIQEIRMLAGRPWDPDKSMARAELPVLQRLFNKGLLEGVAGQRPHLSEAGKLLRQLLVCSKHIEPNPDVWTSPLNVLDLLIHAASWNMADISHGFVMKHVEKRVIDGEPHMIVRLNEGYGNYSEWAIARSAVKRIG